MSGMEQVRGQDCWIWGGHLSSQWSCTTAAKLGGQPGASGQLPSASGQSGQAPHRAPWARWAASRPQHRSQTSLPPHSMLWVSADANSLHSLTAREGPAVLHAAGRLQMCDSADYYVCGICADEAEPGPEASAADEGTSTAPESQEIQARNASQSFHALLYVKHWHPPTPVAFKLWGASGC